MLVTVDLLRQRLVGLVVLAALAEHVDEAQLASAALGLGVSVCRASRTGRQTRAHSGSSGAAGLVTGVSSSPMVGSGLSRPR